MVLHDVSVFFSLFIANAEPADPQLHEPPTRLHSYHCTITTGRYIPSIIMHWYLGIYVKLRILQVDYRHAQGCYVICYVIEW